eukprot:CAMPEP_0178481154 /NCGR_PEP_ID=MMETSP0696-20121128/6064_1 /TAXON_ID=265572 /ORGANISM="Extubocellulus spinifer, Strain CCMP396" /LENGTH=35 /DNA_ID= /DNA_START= /DNA_END= /DNA_ORIENTATION=
MTHPQHEASQRKGQCRPRVPRQEMKQLSQMSGRLR